MKGGSATVRLGLAATHVVVGLKHAAAIGITATSLAKDGSAKHLFRCLVRRILMVISVNIEHGDFLAILLVAARVNLELFHFV